MWIRNLGQDKQTDDVQFLKQKLKECYVAEGDTPRCAEIAKLLRDAINKIIKKEGIQSPGGFLPQVSMQPYSSGYEGSYGLPSQIPQASTQAPSWNQAPSNEGSAYGTQYSWNQMTSPQVMPESQDDPYEPTARRAGLDPSTQYSWNQTMEEEEPEESTLPPEVARRAGLVPNMQYSWNQSMSGFLGRAIPLAGGLGRRALS